MHAHEENERIHQQIVVFGLCNIGAAEEVMGLGETIDKDATSEPHVP